MGREIERKFLVRGEGWRNAARPPRRLVQGYLARSDVASVRVRLIGDDAAVVTIKSVEEGISRAEFEYPIPVEDARELLALCGGNRVEKHRFEVPHDGEVWEVDVFGGRHEGLVTAELELEAEDAGFTPPDWLGDEVSGDPRYSNEALAGDAG